MLNKLAKRLLKIGVVGAVIATLFAGCTPKIPVQREVGQLNLQNPKLKQQKPTEEVIAIVSPNIAANSEVAKAQNQAPQSPLAMMMMQKMGMNRVNINYDFNNAFSQSYAKRLNKALESSISEIIASKGFRLKGPYATFDDITYQDKKKIYLAFVPKIDFHIYNKVIHTKTYSLYSHIDGVIQIGGNVIITMVEPLTGQVFVKRRINLSDFNIQEPYIYEEKLQTNGENDPITSLMNNATAPKKLIDNTDVALTKAINEFYAKTVAKINTYIDREEILSFKPDIMKLKNLKRF
jgi:hypothetical protein